MKKRHLKMLGVFILLVLIVTVYLIKRYPSKTLVREDLMAVLVEPVKVMDIPKEVEAIGTLVAAQHVKMTAETSGHVASILFRDGEWVKKGTPLIQLDDKVLKAKADSAKAHLRYAENHYQRTILLGKRGAISQQAIDQALAEFEEKKALASESEVAQQKMLLVAPFDGSLGQVKVHPGDYVVVGQELVTLTDIEHLRVEYHLSEKFLRDLKLGQTVTVTTNTYPGKIFTGTLDFISPTVNSENRTISLYATLLNKDRLLTAGLFVNVKQSLGTLHHVLSIPAVSLLSTIDGQEVYKVVGDKAYATAVTIGQRHQENVEVTKGLVQGDKVVVRGQEKLKDGVKVKIQSAGNTS